MRTTGPLFTVVSLLVIVSGVICAIAVIHYAVLRHDVSEIDHPVHATAESVAVREGSREGVRAKVTLLVDGVEVGVELPGMGHNRAAYEAPVHVVYERGRPSSAVLQSDFRAATSTGTKVRFSVALAILILDVGAVLFVFGRLLLPGARRRRPVTQGD